MAITPYLYYMDVVRALKFLGPGVRIPAVRHQDATSGPQDVIYSRL